MSDPRVAVPDLPPAHCGACHRCGASTPSYRPMCFQCSKEITTEAGTDAPQA